MNDIVVNIEGLSDHFRVKILPLRFGQRLTDIGSVNLRKLFYLFIFLVRLVGTLIMFRPRLLYFTIMPTGKVFYRDALITAISKFFGVKMIFHLHGKGVAAAAAANPGLAARYQKTFSNAYTICLSPSLVADIAPVYKGHPFVVPNGIADKAVSHNAKDNPAPVILYLSNLMLSKGIKTLFEAVQVLRKKNLAFELQVVGGEGDLGLEEARDYCRTAGIDDRVKILGPLYGAEKEKLLAGADIFVLPSENEAFPLVILEAMRASLPVISTRVGGIPDLVREQETGTLVPPASPRELAAALENLLEHPEKRLDWGRQGRADYEQLYTLEHFRKNILKVLLQIKEETS